MLRASRVLCASTWLVQPVIKIDLAHGTDRERQTKALLEQVLGSYNLSKYTFTRAVVIEERAVNHAFPVLTLNVRFAQSADELLSSYGSTRRSFRTSRRLRRSYAGTIWTSGRPVLTSPSRRRPCVAFACAERSPETSSPSRAGVSASWGSAREPLRARQVTQPPRLPRPWPWPAPQPPCARPCRDSSACIYAPSHNDRARCAPGVRWFEQS